MKPNSAINVINKNAFYAKLFHKDYAEIQNEFDAHVTKYQTHTKKVSISATDYKAKTLEIAKKSVQTILQGKKTVEVPVRVPVAGHLTTIDALNYVTKMSTYCDDSKHEFQAAINAVFASHEIEQHEKDRLADEFSFYVIESLGDIFGSKFTHVTRNLKGLHGYKYQYTIGDDEYTLGKICFGGNKDTVLVMITGKGCYMADDGWELSLYQFLKDNYGYLTRIDICLDDFNGDFITAESADLAESQGKFMLTNVRPKVQQLGDWKHHTGDGRTLQVGRRENGKMFRGYEKGKQLGDPDSLWFRAEIEFKNKDRVLPLDMLLHPTDYFAGAYQYCYELVELKQKDIFDTVEKIEIIQKDAEISTQKAIEVMKHQFGKYIKTLREMITDDIAISFNKSKDTILLDMIQTDLHGQKAIPKRLRVTDGYFQKLTDSAIKVNHCINRPIPF